VAGLGRAGGDGGTLMVSLAADARAAAPRREKIEGICMVGGCHDAESVFCVGVGFNCGRCWYTVSKVKLDVTLAIAVRQGKFDWPTHDWTLAEELYLDHSLTIAFQSITSNHLRTTAYSGYLTHAIHGTIHGQHGLASS
jgi:hypothetical protein